MGVIEDGLNDEFMINKYYEVADRLNIPAHGMGIKDFVKACMATIKADPYLTMFALNLRLGVFNPVRGGLFCSEDELVIQDPFKVYKPYEPLGTCTGIRRKATYRGLVSFLHKAAEADTYKHMMVKDLYDSIINHYQNKKPEKYDPINDFLNIDIDDDWTRVKQSGIRNEVSKKLGPGRWSSFFDVYTLYGVEYTEHVIRAQGNSATGRRSREGMNNMQNILNAKVKVPDELQEKYQFLRECEGCTTYTDDPLVDKIMEHSSLCDANVVNTFRKYLHETTQDYLIYDDVNKNLAIWQQQIHMLKRKHRTFAEDLAYKVWSMRYWDSTGYKLME